MGNPILELRDLVIEYPSPRGEPLRAVDRVSLRIEEGEILALVGESGCGKTTVGQATLGLVAPRSGEMCFDGRPFPTDGRGWKRLRREVAIVFQDPYASLDPLWSVGGIIVEPLRVHGLARGGEMRERAAALAEMVGLEEALLRRKPNELSGGQRQRVAIARALATGPKLVIADEPTAALDVSIRAQVLNLLKDLQQRLGLAMLFISHDLSTVRSLANRVAVMYAGAIVETGPCERVLAEPLHPYAHALIRSLPEVGEYGVLPPVLEGEVPDPLTRPSGCRFRTRCAIAEVVCAEREPALISSEEGAAACHFPGKCREFL